jgi:hypothetical protein
MALADETFEQGLTGNRRVRFTSLKTLPELEIFTAGDEASELLV